MDLMFLLTLALDIAKEILPVLLALLVPIVTNLAIWIYQKYIQQLPGFVVTQIIIPSVAILLASVNELLVHATEWYIVLLLTVASTFFYQFIKQGTKEKKDSDKAFIKEVKETEEKSK